MAVRFAASSTDYLTKDLSSAISDTGEMTLAFWGYRVTNTGGYSTLVDMGATQLIYDYSGSDNLALYSNSDVNSGIALPVGSWFHVAVTHLYSVGWNVYLNGDQVISGGDGYVSPGSFRLGSNGTWGEPSNSRLAQFLIYNRVLQRDEILRQMHQASPITQNNLVAWWQLQPANRLFDASGRGNHLTQTGTLTDEMGPSVPLRPFWFVPFSVSTTTNYRPTASVTLATSTNTPTLTGGSGSVIDFSASVTLATNTRTVTATSAGIAYVNVASSTSGPGVTSRTVSVPTGTLDGDIMLAVCIVELTNATITADAAWGTELFRVYPAGSRAITMAVFARVASGEPANYTFSWSSAECSAAIITYRNASLSSLYAGVGTNAAQTGVPAPVLSVPAAGNMSVWFGGIMYGTTFTAPTNYTERLDIRTSTASTNQALSIAEYKVPSSGNQTPSGTAANGDYNVGGHVVLLSKVKLASYVSLDTDTSSATATATSAGVTFSPSVTLATSTSSIAGTATRPVTATIALATSTNTPLATVAHALTATTTLATNTGSVAWTLARKLTGAVTLATNTGTVTSTLAHALTGSVALATATNTPAPSMGRALTGSVTLATSTAGIALYFIYRPAATVTLATATGTVGSTVAHAVAATTSLATATTSIVTTVAHKLTPSVTLVSASTSIVTTTVRLLTGSATHASNTSSIGFTIAHKIIGSVAFGSATNTPLLVAARPIAFASALGTATNTPAINFARALTGASALATVTSSALLTALRPITGAVTLGTATPTIVGILAHLITVASAQATSTSATGTTVAHAIAATTPLSTDTSISSRDIARALIGAATLDTATNTPVYAITHKLTGSATFDTDTGAALLVALRPIVATVALSSATTDILAPTARLLVGAVTLATNTSTVTASATNGVFWTAEPSQDTGTGDIEATVERPLVGSISLATSATASATVARRLPVGITLDSITYNATTVRDVKLTGSATLAGYMAPISLSAARSLPATVTLDTATGSIEIALDRGLTGSVSLASATSNMAGTVARVLASACVTTSDTSTPLIAAQRPLAPVVALATATNGIAYQLHRGLASGIVQGSATTEFALTIYTPGSYNMTATVVAATATPDVAGTAHRLVASTATQGIQTGAALASAERGFTATPALVTSTSIATAQVYDQAQFVANIALVIESPGVLVTIAHSLGASPLQSTATPDIAIGNSKKLTVAIVGYQVTGNIGVTVERGLGFTAAIGTSADAYTLDVLRQLIAAAQLGTGTGTPSIEIVIALFATVLQAIKTELAQAAAERLLAAIIVQAISTTQVVAVPYLAQGIVHILAQATYPTMGAAAVQPDILLVGVLQPSITLEL